VLDIGCTGKLHLLIEKKALECHGLDVLTPEEAKAHCQCDYWQVDLDEAKHLPYLDIQLIVCGEIIEHLSNAGHFLQLLRRTKCPVILTTPNALNDVVRRYAEMNIEQVNKQHVAWYSYHTLKTLVERHGFKVLEWGWYGGKPVFAEGLIFLLG
jgi:2-polyprenyl-3-methyl-5-hydroxy-6-metoxy-1,4-benzoquinol methylase